MPRGGARPGSGRKPLREKFTKQIEGAEGLYANALAMAAQKLIERAQGGCERVEVKYAAAGTVMIEDVVRDGNGDVMMDTRTRRPLRAKQPAFPDLPADELVVVERKVTTLEPDKDAAAYITDRILGRPVAAVEAEVSGPDGDPMLVAFTRNVLKAYGDNPIQASDRSSDLPSFGSDDGGE